MSKRNYYKPNISVKPLYLDVLMLSTQIDGNNDVDGDIVTIGSEFWK